MKKLLFFALFFTLSRGLARASGDDGFRSLHGFGRAYLTKAEIKFKALEGDGLEIALKTGEVLEKIQKMGKERKKILDKMDKTKKPKDREIFEKQLALWDEKEEEAMGELEVLGLMDERCKD